jgi:hypothetical protein
MNVPAIKVMKWVDTNCPPLSWRILVMKEMKLLLANKVSPAKIDDKTFLSQDIVKAFRESIKKDYNKDLPDFN